MKVKDALMIMLTFGLLIIALLTYITVLIQK